MGSKPLDGIKVIEIAQEIQGPFASLFLSDLGAKVVKVENRETGDLSRFMMAALIGGPNVKNPQVSHYFIAMNRGKRSITLDLKHSGGVEVARRMAARYDVLLTNYRPGVLDRLGLGFEELHRLNPRLVYAQGSSWGAAGPWVTRPSRDTLAQAASGLMAKTGMPSDLPLPAGMLVGDHCGALSLAGGIMAALFAREQNRTRATRGRFDLRHADRDAIDGDRLHLDQRPGAGARRPGPSVFARRVGRLSDQRRSPLYRGHRRPAMARVLPNPRHPASRERFRILPQRHPQLSRRQDSGGARRNLPAQDDRRMARRVESPPISSQPKSWTTGTCWPASRRTPTATCARWTIRRQDA